MSNDPSACFNCDAIGGGYYRVHEGPTKWFIGLAVGGQAHYACEDCHELLFDATPLLPAVSATGGAK